MFVIGTGNYGLWDQHMAIKWVKDNIRSFGGDDGRITLSGISSGAASSVAHMVAEHSSKLFQRVIAEVRQLLT